MFTGDRSGDWLYRALYRGGFATQPEATSRHDGQRLRGAYITAVVRCVPPANRPTAQERRECRSWLEAELDMLGNVEVVVALGGVAFTQMLHILDARGAPVPRPRPAFRHGAEVDMRPQGPLLLGSYHPSQQNTFTGRLTEEMLDAIFTRACRALEE